MRTNEPRGSPGERGKPAVPALRAGRSGQLQRCRPASSGLLMMDRAPSGSLTVQPGGHRQRQTPTGGHYSNGITGPIRGPHRHEAGDWQLPWCEPVTRSPVISIRTPEVGCRCGCPPSSAVDLIVSQALDGLTDWGPWRKTVETHRAEPSCKSRRETSLG